jgi:uncharacterized OB-fold protein
MRTEKVIGRDCVRCGKYFVPYSYDDYKCQSCKKELMDVKP